MLISIYADMYVPHARPQIQGDMITAYALKMFREDREMSTKKQAEKARKDPVKSHAPLKPISGSSMFISLHLVLFS